MKPYVYVHRTNETCDNNIDHRILLANFMVFRFILMNNLQENISQKWPTCICDMNFK